MHGLTTESSLNQATGLYTETLLIELDNVYVHIIQEDASYYYIELRRPKEVYNKVLVIDAGHGGKDPGAISTDGKYYEKDINLKILLSLKELLDKEPIKVYYTRLSDEKIFLRPRVTLANSVDCDFFVSIHCNANDVTWPNGSEIYYYDYNYKNVKNEKLAELFCSELSKTISLKQNGLYQKHNDEVFILEKSLVPSLLIESGFVTNHNDLNYLLKDENIKSIARGIYSGIMKAYKEFDNTKVN
jgi:N-acetylmuramoyl-L-alanine amidase